MQVNVDLQKTSLVPLCSLDMTSNTPPSSVEERCFHTDRAAQHAVQVQQKCL